MINLNKYAVILCGGGGARLWPISRSEKPKQFLLINSTQSLFQETVERLSNKVDLSKLYTVTKDSCAHEVKGQLAGKYVDAIGNVISEPASRNTLPALILAIRKIREIDPEALISVFPSDHSIQDKNAFLDAWENAELGASQGYFMLLGIKPTRAATGYGYIKPAKSGLHKLIHVDQFVEKPNLLSAEKYLKDGYFWNSGIFVFRVDVFMDALLEHQPDIYSEIMKMPLIPSKEEYERIPSISIDRGLAEKLENIAFIPVDMGWNDLGSWDSVYESKEKDVNKNVVKGDVIALDSHSNIIWSDNGLVSVIGLDNMIVVHTPDSTMVCSRNRSEEVKNLVEHVQHNYPNLTKSHAKVERPWGYFAVLQEGPFFKIKSIYVKPGGRLSLQYHNYRSEHWVVVKGIATVSDGDQIYEVKTNQSTYIPALRKHRLANNTNNDLIIIEVQTGSVVDEADIVRLEDIYGRELM
jgi:mannose-1-phosphate guanylyltransferase/mannose-6-phosphate isomerase